MRKQPQRGAYLLWKSSKNRVPESPEHATSAETQDLYRFWPVGRLPGSGDSSAAVSTTPPQPSFLLARASVFQFTWEPPDFALKCPSVENQGFARWGWGG